MHARVGRLIAFSALLALLLPIGCAGEPGTGGGGECVIQAGAENVPGYPFNLDKFEKEVVPILKADCASCHDPAGADFESFKTWAGEAAKGNCAFVDTFESVKAASDTTTPENSKLYATRTVTPHDTIDQAKFETLLAYVADAKTTCGDACAGGNGAVTYFDRTIFDTVIQPALDEAGCAVAGCHLAPNGQFGFSLTPTPAEGSEELKDNFVLVTSDKYASLAGEPGDALVYRQATTLHGNQASTQISAAGATAMLDWITTAKAAADADGGPVQVNCADATLLDLRVWKGEILPMLRGEVDYNNQNNDNILTGCTRGPCHGQLRPGKFDLVGTDEETLEKFACFINLENPSRSQVLTCPSDVGGAGGCPVRPHPGGELFVDANDVNYQKMLSFLFASVANRSPVDFAQFARTINILFDDEAACDDELENITCADTGACHGCNVAGCDPPNGSDLGMIPNATDENTLRTNYASAHNFVSFGVPEASSIFLYPTNLIADVNNQFASGIEHGAGQCFASDSVQADAVLAWAEGLRPNDDGFVTSWLVTGAFAGADPDAEKLFNEETVRPNIFEISNGEQFAREWDFFQSAADQVDVGALLDAKGGAVGQGRTAYAAAYLINTTTQPLRVQMDVETNNEFEIYLGDAQGSSPAGGGNASVTFTVPPYSPDTEIPRIMMRMFEAVDDGGLVFTARLVDADNNVPFNGIDDDLILVTGAEGGF